MLSRFISEEDKKNAVNILFYLALTIELVLMIVEKSELSFGYESYVFRFTFFLTLVAVLLTKRDKKEWLIVAAVTVFTAICYYLSGKNDLLRIAFFMMAARDVDLNKAMKYSFFVSLSGFTVIALLSVAGILGDVVQVADYGRGIADETRLVLGFGHPNTLFGCVYVLVLMWIWIYGEKAQLLWHVVVAVISFVFAASTRTRTGIAVLAMTLVLEVIIRLFPRLKEIKALYVLTGIVTPVFCIVSAAVCAYLAEAVYTMGTKNDPKWGWFWKLEAMFNNRVSNLYYGVPNQGGILRSWKLFAERNADGYFDMGWVRLFYWYGIIPTALIAVTVILLIYVCCKKRDLWTLLIILSVSVYTIIEATFVSRYIGRGFYLVIAGSYLGYLFKGKTDDSKA